MVTLGRDGCRRRTLPELDAKSRMRVEQEPGRELRPAESSHRLAIARSREIEQAETLEEWRVGHACVERADELFGDVEFPLGRLGISLQGGLALGAGTSGLEDFEQSRQAKQRQREPGREQRVDDSGGRREQGPLRPDDLVAPECDARRVDERERGAGRAELIANRRQALEQAIPGWRALGSSKVGRESIRERGAGARDSVVEAQHPDPAAWKHVVKRGRVRRVWRRTVRGRDAGPEIHALKVREEALCRWQPSQRRVASAECRCQKSTWAAGIDDEPGLDFDRLPLARACERHSTGRVADALETRFVEVNRARRLRLFDQREIECRAVPVRISNLVVRAAATSS